MSEMARGREEEGRWNMMEALDFLVYLGLLHIENMIACNCDALFSTSDGLHMSDGPMKATVHLNQC